MLPIIVSFAIGIGAILVASKIFLSLSTEFSARWKVSPLFIAVVVLALGTSLPELTVTIASIIQKDPGLALGNAVGSSITNLTLIFGLTAMFGVVKIGTKKTQITGLIMLAIMLFFVLIHFSSLPGYLKSVLLLCALGAGLWYEFRLALSGRVHEDKKFLKKLLQQRKKPKFTGGFALLALIVSTSGLGVGGMITVKAVHQLSVLLGTSTTILGMSLNSLATTIPELSMAITASTRRENKVVIGTLVGSNIFNLTLFPALIYFFANSTPLPLLQLTILGVTSVLFAALLFKYKGTIVPLSTSLFLLGLYALFALTNLQTITH